MITFPEFLILNNDFNLFEATSFCQLVLDKLTPSEKEEFIQFIKDADATNIMRIIRSVHTKKYKKGKLHP